MAQIDSYLKRVLSECEWDYHEDYYDLYSFVNNQELRTLFAMFHTQLNIWFSVINKEISIQYDDNGNVMYEGGYLNAQNSRSLLSVLETIDKIEKVCQSTEYAFCIANGSYKKRVSLCKEIIRERKGSYIPEGFPSIEIEELSPIFQLVERIAIKKGKETVYAKLVSVGQGSYARVFSYVDPTYHFRIIIKRALNSLNSTELERFKQEFNVLHSLHSPYIIEVYSYNDEKHEYSMEYMDESIDKYITKNNNTLSLSQRKRLITQVCHGLSYIHRKKLLHRDISLTNVFIKHYDDVDVVKIGDFGLVKIPDSQLTSFQSELKGAFNDPDLVNVGFSNYEMCHETYALTRLCYFILTGRTNIVNQKDGAIRRFWIKGTNTDKTQRFQSVEEVLSAVHKITEENK